MLKKQQLYQQLKQDIQLQYWAAAQVLTQQQLAAHYGVSRIVVRDAQQQLMSEGWLSAHGKAGMQVATFSVAEAEELCMLRLQLEPLALRLAASELSFSQLGQAEDVLRQLAQYTAMPAYQRGELNWQFHRLLYQPCGKVHLLRLLDQLHQQVARYLGYQDALLAAGIKPEPQLQLNTDFTAQAGYVQTQQALFKQHGSLDGIYAASDAIAMGAMKALLEHNIKVPQQVALVGFDDIAMSAYCTPSLTTVKQDTHAGGKLLVAQLLSRINGGKAASQLLPVKLIERQSSLRRN